MYDENFKEPKRGDRLISLMEKSTLTQSAITIALVGTLCSLVLMGKDVPQIIESGVMLVMGFYFGSKSANVIASLRR